jgi:hypothetical protein
MMSLGSKNFLNAALGLTLATFLATTLQVQVAKAGVSDSGAILLAQKAEPEKAKAPPPKAPLKKPEQRRPAPRPQPQPEQMQRRTRSFGHAPRREAPARAGTQKFGGQPIRAKETPPGE